MAAEPASGCDGERRYKVVIKQVAFRCKPSTTAEIVHAAKQGSFLSGVVHDIDGKPWLSLSAAELTKYDIKLEECWVLIDGKHLGLGTLLRPVHDEFDNLEELLWRMVGDKGGERVRPVLAALHKENLRTGRQFLEATETPASAEQLQERVAAETTKHSCVVPMSLVGSMRMTVQDTRLVIDGYPDSPPWTSRRILFTAPHSLPLRREGHKPHVPEAYTSYLAREFANVVGGACLTWTQREEQRARAFFKQHSGQPDITNKDPNYTPRDALADSPWTRSLRDIHTRWPPDRPCLHVDLHGCKDPSPSGGSHLVVGLRAMELKGRKGQAEDLRKLLHKTLAVALRGVSVNMRPQKQLTGAIDEDQYTLTQQSLETEGGSFAWSMQLEMSRRLREKLKDNDARDLRDFMAQAIMFAWILACGDEPDPGALVYKMQHWSARCKAFYAKHGHLDSFFGPDDADGSPASPVGGSPSPRSPDASKTRGRIPEEAPVCTEAVRVRMESTDEDEDDDEDDEDGDDGDDAAGEADEVAGEATANTEPRSSPCAGTIQQIESDLTRQARSLKGYEVEKDNIPQPIPSKVAQLRDWLRSTTDIIPVIVPKHTYSVAAIWSNYVPMPMEWDGSRFCHSFAVPAGAEGCTFQVLENSDWGRTLYPNVDNANPCIKYKLMGPDGGGHGKNWLITRIENVATNLDPTAEKVQKASPAKEGDCFTIYLSVDPDGICTGVSWIMLGAHNKARLEREVAEKMALLRKAEQERELQRRMEAEAKKNEEIKQRMDAEAKKKEARLKAMEEERARKAEVERRFAEARQQAEAERAERRAEREAAKKQSRPTSGVEWQVKIHIDRDMGLFSAVKVVEGTNIWMLKEQIAQQDPTGRTTPDDLGLRLCNSGGDLKALLDTFQLTPAITELEACEAA
eukprot:gnl/TRDRNA2_/TRDRNA2_168822_c0_seq1.p1 gnl/TRDRNA2_/TRDRNA2_168822_c0~~gnl/TRDRNA2_/TRDRNA2_168822_c0_seq1.p1  ORF type:complete len:913 (+),score=172.26 gnl/TRDRNA2_/TRDRNA2_168822_c0_seq1:173-2911(+)